MLTPIPVTVITGFLGVGKTTAIRHALANKPADEPPWAVLVNEFGEIGIDGALLEGGGVTVREIPGGCICCTSSLALKTNLVRVLRDVRPGRLLIEPTGLAHPATILDMLRARGIREAVLPRATITLIDPRRLSEERVRSSSTFNDQVTVADVLVANKTDLCEPGDLQAFRSFAAEQWPAPLVVAETAAGALDPGWLDLDPTPEPSEHHDDHHHGHDHDHDHGHDHDLHDGLAGVTHGWIWPPARVFDQFRLTLAFQQLVHPNPHLPSGALRIKGLFRVQGAWVSLQADPDAIRFEPTGWRRDSRLEIIAPTGTEPNWEGILQQVLDASF